MYNTQDFISLSKAIKKIQIAITDNQFKQVGELKDGFEYFKIPLKRFINLDEINGLKKYETELYHIKRFKNDNRKKNFQYYEISNEYVIVKKGFIEGVRPEDYMHKFVNPYSTKTNPAHL